jgi:hypothetical protein
LLSPYSDADGAVEVGFCIVSVVTIRPRKPGRDSSK